MCSDDRSTATLVMGAPGLIGRQVVRRLIACGRSAVAMARQQNGLSAGARVMKALGVIPVGLPQLTVIDARRTRWKTRRRWSVGSHAW